MLAGTLLLTLSLLINCRFLKFVNTFHLVREVSSFTGRGSFGNFSSFVNF